MADEANRSFLRLCVAKICQDVGFNSIQSTPLEVLTDLLQDYITAMAKTAYNYALHCGNTEPNLNHLALAFRDMGVSITELKEYVRYVDSSSVVECPKYPVANESHLNLLKPGSREVVTRPFHIHEHLPPMHPHLEDQDLSVKQEPSTENSMEVISPTCNNKSKSLKRDATTEGFPTKRNRFVCEEEGRPLRELSSVMMTTSGFLSPAREGKLPEAKTPLIRAEFSCNQESNTPQPCSEQKIKKKGKLSPDQRKADKESKASCEKEAESIIKDDDPIKQKKSSTGKDPAKKIKISSVKNASPVSASVTGSPTKAHKKVKSSLPSNAPLVNPLHVTKNIKVKSPKNEKQNQLILTKETSITITTNQIPPEYKLSSEPDKQKLNIFKKIQKVKDEMKDDLDENILPETGSLSRVDVTIESVIKREMGETFAEQEFDVKDEVVDIETVHSPSPYQTLLSNNNEVEEPTPLPSPTVNIIKEEKKKKKIKKISKKESSCELDFSVVKTIKTVPEGQTIHETIEEVININSSQQNMHATLQIISERISNPPPAPLLLENIIKKDVQPVPPVIPSISEAVTCQNQKVAPQHCLFISLRKESNVAGPTITKYEDGLDSLSKKKLHKKDKKDKLKKKKKDKIKNKDKSEKRKLRLEKKGKDKEKQRIKKEKKERKKGKEVEEIKSETANPVPKITLKLGPASPANSADSNSRKIVIIPVKKEVDVSKPERAPSPELARFSPLVPNPKQKPIKPFVIEEIKISMDSKVIEKPVDSTSLPPSVRLDSDGNKVWICPSCGRQDDGSPMIGCDECDAWYHWVCVGIQVPPEAKTWYCNTCLNKKKVSESEKKKKNKKKTAGKKFKEN